MLRSEPSGSRLLNQRIFSGSSDLCLFQHVKNLSFRENKDSPVSTHQTLNDVVTSCCHKESKAPNRRDLNQLIYEGTSDLNELHTEERIHFKLKEIEIVSPTDDFCLMCLLILNEVFVLKSKPIKQAEI